MYRCIIFDLAFPSFIERDGRLLTYHGTAYTSEQAMMAAVYEVIGQEVPAWLRQATTWQPSTGIVFVNLTPCGVVFEVVEDRTTERGVRR
jgi:hypothetical protein